MEATEQLVLQQTLLNSKLVFSSVEQSGIISEVERLRQQQPELSVTEATNHCVNQIKTARGIKDDKRSRIQEEITTLTKKADALSNDSIANDDELKATLKQIDNLKKQL